MPKKESDLDEKKNTIKDYKEQISIMEQVYASLKIIYSKKLKKKIIGQDTFSLEYIAHENQILFYIVCPKPYRSLIEKQITWIYPDAIIEETTEINIFENKKYYEWTYLYPKKAFYLPIKTYQKQESDPINNITNALSKMSSTSAAIQILLKPIDDDWQKDCFDASSKMSEWKKLGFSLNPLKLIDWILEIISTDKKNNKSKPAGKKTSALTQERSKTVDEKWNKTGFETVIRVVITGNNKNKISMELKNIVSSFYQFSSPDFNKFKSTQKHNNYFLVKNYIYRYFRKPFWINKSILNTEELSSIFHVPNIKYNKTPDIKWQNFKIIKWPVNLPKEWVLIWYNIYRWIKTEVKIKTEDRFRHFYVIWQTGTWKSSVLQVMARQDLKEWRWIAVMDPHWDLVKDLIPFIPRSRADDIIVFDPTDVQRPLWLNMLEIHNDDEVDLVTNDATAMMLKLFGNEVFWPRIQDYFRNWVMALMYHPNWWTIVDIVKMFTDESFQAERIKYLRNPIVKDWWEKTYASMWDREKQEMIPYFAAKFGQFISNKTMRNILWQAKSSFDVFDVMQKWQILMINLSKWSLWDINSQLLGMILVNKIQQSAMRRDKVPKNERTDFFLYIDEFQNYVTDSIESILSEARKYRLSLNIAHQYMGQLEKSDSLSKSSVNLKDAILWNVWTKMCYKIGSLDWDIMEKEFAPTYSGQDLINMDKFKAAIKLSIDNEPSVPFSIIPANPYLEKPDDNLAKAYYQLSRLKYGRDVAFVWKEIEYRIWS